MAISVNFRDVHRCSRISPEITIYDPPKGTTYYEARLVEYGKRERYLGGGSWPEDGSGIIPEGALTRYYTGPCPPDDQDVEYGYIISAMKDRGSQPLSVRIFRFRP